MNDIAGQNIALGNIELSKTKIPQSTKKVLRIRGCRANPEIDIAGGPRAAMESEGKRTDDHVLNMVAVERGNKIVKIRMDFHWLNL